MSKIWVDPPDGWRYGFPKLYDEDVDGPMEAWLHEQEYPNPDYPVFVRSWLPEDDINVQDD